ncbi:ArnT family glycosyltransferase [Acidomonas methanolica]|uniref:ArnT family glycosyltransferase n=1 Tax=Acidomonas methanolica TaxID=437 RepID=UPI00211A38AE|nr:glycosyltransferase family 39 protein [Acidomonas methanolica]
MPWLIALLLALTALRLVMAAVLPLTPDEAYYWTWSHHLQGGYLDHPGMVALWIRIGTALAGDSPFGVRWLGPVSALLGTALVWDAARVFAPGRRGGMRAALLLNGTLMIGLGAITMTPDTPLVFFTACALWAAARLIAGADWRWLVPVAAALGLAFSSKYTAALTSLATILWVMTARSGGRKWAWTLVAGGVGTLFVLPVVCWNAEHGWISFLKQGGRAGMWRPARAIQFLGELLGGQFALATPLIFLLFVIGAWHVAREARRNEAARLLAFWTVIPAVVFLEHALGDRVQANWPVVLYPALALAAARLARPVGAAAGLGIGLGLLVCVQALTHLFPLPPRLDVIARQTGGWEQLAATLRATASPGDAIYAEDYGVASELAYYGGALQVRGVETRWSATGLPQTRATPGVFLLRADRRPPEDVAGLRVGQRIGTACRFRGACYDVYRLGGDAAPQIVTILPSRH